MTMPLVRISRRKSLSSTRMLLATSMTQQDTQAAMGESSRWPDTWLLRPITVEPDVLINPAS
jgi:hypothetical protein